jgi:hypothetical protein
VHTYPDGVGVHWHVRVKDAGMTPMRDERRSELTRLAERFGGRYDGSETIGENRRPTLPPAKRRNVGRATALEIVVVLAPLSRFGGRATPRQPRSS